MQKWGLNGFFGAPIEPIKNRSAVAVWGLGRGFGPNCGLWRSLFITYRNLRGPIYNLLPRRSLKNILFTLLEELFRPRSENII